MRRHPEGVVYVSERQRRLLDELQALARATDEVEIGQLGSWTPSVNG